MLFITRSNPACTQTGYGPKFPLPDEVPRLDAPPLADVAPEVVEVDVEAVEDVELLVADVDELVEVLAPEVPEVVLDAEPPDVEVLDTSSQAMVPGAPPP